MRVVVSGYHGFGNIGDEAVLAALIQQTREIAPEAEYVALSGDPARTVSVHGIGAIPRTSVAVVVRELRRADLLVSGGGSLLQDATGRGSVPYYAGIMLLARMLGVPVSVYAQGVGPLNSGAARRLARLALSRASVITLRDPGSMELVRQIGVTKPQPVLVADPAFALEPEDAGDCEASLPPCPRVMFALRPWPGADNREAVYAGVIQRVCNELGANVVLLAFQPDTDLAVASGIADLCEAGGCARPQVVAFHGSPGQALSTIAQADLVVGMRLHSLIFAASAGVPTVAIDYDLKVRALAERMGNTHVVSVDAPPEEIVRVVLDAWEQRDKAGGELAMRVADLKRQAREAARLALSPIVDRPAECGRARVLGVPVDCVSMDEAVEKALEMASSGRGGHVVTLNPEMTLSAGDDAALNDVIAGADLVVPDGVGVVRALGMLGYRPRGRVPGIELAANLMEKAAEQGMSVYLIGARPGVAQQAADAMLRAFPCLTIGGTSHGYFAQAEEPAVLDSIARSGAAFVFVGMGAGKQEKWIARARSAAPRAVWIGVGGSFDVMSGNVKRAPAVYQRLGLEWLYRLAAEPRRAKRMTALPVFMFRVIAEACRRRCRSWRRS
ncbi:MAG: putative N-acetylmannosaminyltransferase [Firmicutes bacterium ADurb.BinA052]|nr:MAG: putative N-acetylmannosaminyltransferase [Firmicutes bacterium ADurb.BinA052]